MTIRANWIAVDWGTTRLRTWAMAADNSVLAERSSDRGMGSLAQDEFEDALLTLVADWLTDTPINVMACGMVGAKQGWAEANYRTVPATPVGGSFTVPLTHDDRLQVYILPGLRQDQPADVMRGEETQIAGYLSENPNFDGVICLPGTHTKWARVSAGEIVSFQTYMTGELFFLISEKSVLRHSMQGNSMVMEAFSQAIEDIISRPEKLAAHLFGLRAESLLHDLQSDVARPRLSGMLLGAELAAARPYWLGQAVTIIGAPILNELYATALKSQAAVPTVVDGNTASLSGLIMAHKSLLETIK